MPHIIQLTMRRSASFAFGFFQLSWSASGLFTIVADWLKIKAALATELLIELTFASRK